MTPSSTHTPTATYAAIGLTLTGSPFDQVSVRPTTSPRLLAASAVLARPPARAVRQNRHSTLGTVRREAEGVRTHAAGDRVDTVKNHRVDRAAAAESGRGLELSGVDSLHRAIVDREQLRSG